MPSVAPTETGSEPRLFVNRPDARGAASSDLRELWEYRDVVRAFAGRTLRVRYKESFFGILWVILQPLTLLVPFIVVLGRVAGITGGGVPYAAFAASVVVPWQFVANALNNGTVALVNEGPLIRKVYFPRSAPVAGALVAAGFDLGVGLILAVPLVALLGGQVTWTALLAPLVLLPLLVVAFAVSLVLAGLFVRFRDVKFVLPLLTQGLLYASPVAFPVDVVPKRWRLLYAAADPLVGPLDSVRRCLALGQLPDWGLFAASTVTATLLALAALAAFARLQQDVADLV